MTTQTFRIVIRTDGGRRSQQAFQNITNSANNTGSAVTQTVNVIVNGMGRAQRSVRGLQNQMDRMNRSSVPFAARIGAMMRSFVIPGAAATSLRNWGRAARGLAGAFAGMYVGRQLMEATDAGTRLTNTLRGFGATESGLKTVRQRIFEISNEARVSANETAVLYGRLTLATSNLGLTQEEVLGMTKTMSQALQLSGSSGLEASQSIRQLSQAFNKGKLDGDEFRSVLENAPIITKMLTDELQISKDMLYDWAASGKITVRTLVRAFRNGEKAIDADFQKLERTIGSALIQMYNDFIRFMVAFDERTDISKNMIAGIDLIRNHFDDLADTLKVVLGYYVAMQAISFATPAGLIQTARTRTLQSNPNFHGPMPPPPVSKWQQLTTLSTQFLVSLFSIRTVGEVLQGLFGRLVYSFRFLSNIVKLILTPFRILAASAAAFVGYFGFGFLDGLQKSLGTATKIEAVFKTIRLLSITIGLYFRETMEAVFGSITKFFEDFANNTIALLQTLRTYIADYFTGEGVAESYGRSVISRYADWIPFVSDEVRQEMKKMAPMEAEDKTTFESYYRKALEEQLEDPIRFSDVFEIPTGLGRDLADSLSGILEPAVRLEEYTTAYDAMNESIRAVTASIEELQKSSTDATFGENAIRLSYALGQISDNTVPPGGRLIESLVRDPSEQSKAHLADIHNQIASLTDFLSKTSSVLSDIEAKSRASAGLEEELQQAIDNLEAVILKDNISEAAKQGAQQLIDEANAILTSGAAQIRTNVLNAFTGGIPGIVSEYLNAGRGPGSASILETGLEGLSAGARSGVEDLNTYNNSLVDITGRLQKMQETGIHAFDKVGSAAQGTASQMERFFQQTFGNLEDALVDFVTTGEFDFKKFINAVIADLARLFIRMLIIQPMMNMMGFGMLGFRSGGLVPKIQGYATGGLIGGVGSSTSDRYLAAVSPGEFMMNSAATRRNYPDLVRMNNGGEPRRRSGSSFDQTINFAPQVTVVNDGGSDQGGQDQGEQIATLIQQSFIEMITREQRQGGLLASTAPRGFV